VLVLGTGLIGTSVGLALRDLADVLVDDRDPRHLDDAVRRGAGRPWNGIDAVDLAVVCAPPAATAELVVRLLRLDVAPAVSHVSSAQSRVQHHVETSLGSETELLDRLCGGHPLAGRETRGPAAASARLFMDRPWVVCPSSRTSSAAVEAVRWLARSCGATPVELTAASHDAAVALVSHLPQVAASALAAQLLGGPAGPQPGGTRTRVPASGAHALAGPGVQDTTRIAASDPDLWADILASNAEHVAPLVRAMAEELTAAADALDALGRGAPGGSAAAAATVRDLIERGNRGRASLPLKRSDGAEALTSVLVAVPDRPGQLAGVLVCAADSGINVEDVHVEHLSGRPRGLVELVVRQVEAAAARQALSAAGWDVLEP
jgi:prephenate dehydrogenase